MIWSEFTSPWICYKALLSMLLLSFVLWISWTGDFQPTSFWLTGTQYNFRSPPPPTCIFELFPSFIHILVFWLAILLLFSMDIVLFCFVLTGVLFLIFTAGSTFKPSNSWKLLLFSWAFSAYTLSISYCLFRYLSYHRTKLFGIINEHYL